MRAPGVLRFMPSLATTYDDAPPRESSRFLARERRPARPWPILCPKLSRSLFNRAIWVNNPVPFGPRKEPVAKWGRRRLHVEPNHRGAALVYNLIGFEPETNRFRKDGLRESMSTVHYAPWRLRRDHLGCTHCWSELRLVHPIAAPNARLQLQTGDTAACTKRAR